MASPDHGGSPRRAATLLCEREPHALTAAAHSSIVATHTRIEVAPRAHARTGARPLFPGGSGWDAAPGGGGMASALGGGRLAGVGPNPPFNGPK